MTDRTDRALLDDSPDRDYSEKLELFNRFAEPELREIIGGLGLRSRERVLDVGCGAGLVTAWLAEHVGAEGLIVGLDMATGHVGQACRNVASSGLPVYVVQGDMVVPPFPAETFDWIWCGN